MRELHIATASSFYDAPSNQVFSWPALVRLLSSYDAGEETLEAYLKLSKNDQLRLKDRGWFNGNTYSKPERHTECITGVDLLALDIDNGGPDIALAVLREFDADLGHDGFAYFVGSTRKHTPEHPRLRLVIPLSRTCTVDEADALKRMIAFRIGMKAFDAVSFRANQVMFWPSRCADGAIYVQESVGDWLDVDAALARWYPNGWHKRESWPLHGSEDRESIGRERRKAGDPLEKPGLVGLWCRTYSIEQAMEKFLPGEYLPGSTEGRYTHAKGSTADGAIVYDGKWLYSHHQTDPGTGQLLNAWDLVRVHKFGHLDVQVQPDVPISRKPSSKQMESFARLDGEFKRALGENAVDEFEDLDEQATRTARIDLASQLAFDRAGQVEATHTNLVKIFRGHPVLKGALAYNHNTGMRVWRRIMPWHDETRQTEFIDPLDGIGFIDVDAIRIRDWLLGQFRMVLPSLTAINEVVQLIADENGFHPIRDHLRSLPQWDGKPRLDTLFVRHLNAEDNAYTRSAARVFLVGAVKRIMEPGCKFDTAVLLIGVPRIRKSAFIDALCGHSAWFSDELPKIGGADAIEHIRSLWFVEIAELATFTRTEIEYVKAFLSRRMDRARLAYEANSRRFMRQCVFVGTTNDFTPIKDSTAAARFLPIVCRNFVSQRVMIDVEAVRAEREQLLAEAYAAWQAGEAIHMTDREAIDGAELAQNEAMVEDPIAAKMDQWLDGDAASVRHPAGLAIFEAKPELRLATCVRQIGVEALGYDESGRDWPNWLAGKITNHLHRRGDYASSGNPRRIPGYGKVRVFERFRAAFVDPDLDDAPAPRAKGTVDL